jgi:hypothetical protein
MRSWILALGLAALLVRPPGTAAAQTTAEAPQTPAYYALQMTGQAHFLTRIAVNGQTVLESDDLVSLGPRAHYLSRYLDRGRNQIDVEFTSDPKQPMSMTVVVRGAAGRFVPVARFQAAAGETHGRRVVKTLGFSAHDVPGTLTLGDGDRRDIANLLQAYYDALARRDERAVLKFYAPAVEAHTRIDPEIGAVDRRVLARDAELYTNPQFRMKPYDSTGLVAAVIGRVVRVTRPGGPVMESEEVPTESTVTFAGGMGHATVTVRVGMHLRSLEFERLNGVWSFAVPTF